MRKATCSCGKCDVWSHFATGIVKKQMSHFTALLHWYRPRSKVRRGQPGVLLRSWFGRDLGLLATFYPVVHPLYFGLGRGPITSPGPAMVPMDRKDLNSNKIKNKVWSTMRDNFLTERLRHSRLTERLIMSCNNSFRQLKIYVGIDIHPSIN